MIYHIVTTCVVVWIEIMFRLMPFKAVWWVTTCVVVWIEIQNSMYLQRRSYCHHLRGGVD